MAANMPLGMHNRMGTRGHCCADSNTFSDSNIANNQRPQHRAPMHCCGHQQVVRVLNNVTWQPLLECHHGTPVDEPPGVAVYQEVEEPRGVLLPVQV